MSRPDYHDIERMALGFVLEDESWPVFLAWCRENGFSDEIRAWLEAGPDLKEVQLEWLRHSPDPARRAMGTV